MQWIAMILPSFISVVLSEQLEKKSHGGMEFVKHAGCYILMNNLIMMMFYQYIMKTPNSFTVNFTDNSFVIHYIILSLLVAIALPLLKLAIKPHISVRVEWEHNRQTEE